LNNLHQVIYLCTTKVGHELHNILRSEMRLYKSNLAQIIQQRVDFTLKNKLDQVTQQNVDFNLKNILDQIIQPKVDFTL